MAAFSDGARVVPRNILIFKCIFEYCHAGAPDVKPTPHGGAAANDHRSGRTGRDHGTRPCAVLDSVRLGFNAIRASARMSRLLVQDSILTIKYRSSASSPTMKARAPAGVTTWSTQPVVFGRKPTLPSDASLNGPNS